jgi:oligosaccharide reducing-end xylanase
MRQASLLLAVVVSLAVAVAGQSARVAAPYEVGTWRGFRAAAVSYTFDDGTENQLPVAIPMFNEFGYKATLFTVTGWVSNWSALQAAKAMGHEIASHTVDHVRLNSLSATDQIYQYAESRGAIDANCGSSTAVTLAYPNCRSGDASLSSQYFIAGRNCSGAIVPPTPPDFYEINSYICGSRGSVKTTADFISRFGGAQAAGGWLVLLLHGIDNDGGYSPLSSQILRESLEYLGARKSTFWVETFGNVVRYIRERDNLSVDVSSEAPGSITLAVSDGLDDDIYQYPVTLRRPLPAGWASATVTQGGQPVPSSVVTVDGGRHVMFDVVPDAGAVVLSNSGTAPGPSAPTGLTASAVSGTVFLDWNDNAETGVSGYNVYRSVVSGSGYARVNGLLVTGSAYEDRPASSGTTYYYVATAVGADGNESPYSAEASATLSGETATTTHIESVVVTTVAAGGPNKKGRATVVVKDNTGKPVANATVTGTFSGTLNETRSGTTDAAGAAVIQTYSFQKTIASLKFCVDGVTHPALAYDPVANAETCGSRAP